MAHMEPTRTTSTADDYFKKGVALFKMAGTELGLTEFRNFVHLPQVITWFLGAHERWAPSSIRQYRLALREVLARVCTQRPDAIEPRAALERLNTSPTPRPNAPKDRRTSARKKKTVTPAEAQAIEAALIEANHRYGPVALGFWRFNVELGLRPGEWVGARIEGSTLIVTNAKRGNGRANGVSRTLDLSAAAPRYAEEVALFLETLNTALANASWKTIHSKIRQLFAAASKQARLTVPSLRGVVSPYTTRHVAAARARRTMDRAGVAALLGHATDRTASVHYARPRSARGWPSIEVSVNPAEVATVRRRYRGIDEPRADLNPANPKA